MDFEVYDSNFPCNAPISPGFMETYIATKRVSDSLISLEISAPRESSSWIPTVGVVTENHGYNRYNELEEDGIRSRGAGFLNIMFRGCLSPDRTNYRFDIADMPLYNNFRSYPNPDMGDITSFFVQQP
jgi:hypothetical protein